MVYRLVECMRKGIAPDYGRVRRRGVERARSAERSVRGAGQRAGQVPGFHARKVEGARGWLAVRSPGTQHARQNHSPSDWNRSDRLQVHGQGPFERVPQISQFFDLPLKPRLKTICGREQAKVEKMAQRWGWENAVTDWRRIIDDPEIRIVDICSPNNTHHEIALAAFEAGKIVACEKPLAMNGAEARR